MSLKVSMFEGMGRGVEAMTAIKADSIIAVCELLVLSQDDTVKVNQTDLQYYTFKYNELQDCLVLGLGEIFNHSDMPNTRYEIKGIDGRDMMVFTTLRDIEAGEQLFTDYNADVKVNMYDYIKCNSMIG